MKAYDAILFVSFGGPEGMEDVMPFLDNVLRGRNVPLERKQAVAHHYEMFGGVSPINGQNRDLIAALKVELQARSITLPVYWGNRNWHPMLEDTVAQMARDGVRHALAFVTSAYGSYSGCRQYLQDIERAQNAVTSNLAHEALNPPVIDKLRCFYNHPRFIEANKARLKEAISLIPQDRRTAMVVAFTAHSVPVAMAETSSYVKELNETARLVMDIAPGVEYQVVFQSRSGPPTQPWLEPDILDHLRALKNDGVNDVVIAPIGFISDHMEVVYDLDYEAKQLAEQIGINIYRAGTAGVHPSFVSMIADLIEERTMGKTRSAIGNCVASPDVCAVDCCNYVPARPPSSAR